MDWLAKIKGDQLVTYIFIIVALIIPGFGYLFLIETDLFFRLDLFRLIFVSILYSIPIFIISFVSLSIGLIISKSNFPGDEDLKMLFLNSLMTILVFLLSISVWYLIKFFNGPEIIKNNLLILMYIIGLSASIFFIIVMYLEEKIK